jgi:hypothetical protein
MKRNLRILPLLAAFSGLATVGHSDTNVFSENFESQSPGVWASVYNYDGHGNPTANIVAGAGVSGSQTLEFTRTTYGSDNFGVNSGTYAISGNTSTSLSDYIVSFDMALGSGSVSDNFNLDFLIYGGGGGQDFSTWGNLPTPGAGFKHYSANMGTLGTMWTGNPLVPTASTWTFSVGKYGGSTVGTADVYIDNIRVTMVPEPSTFALCGLAAGLGLMLRRRA